MAEADIKRLFTFTERTRAGLAPSETTDALTPFESSLVHLASNLNIDTIDGMNKFSPLIQLQDGKRNKRNSRKAYETLSTLGDEIVDSHPDGLRAFTDVVLQTLSLLHGDTSDKAKNLVTNTINRALPDARPQAVGSLFSWVDGLNRLSAEADGTQPRIYNLIYFDESNEAYEVRQTTFAPRFALLKSTSNDYMFSSTVASEPQEAGQILNGKSQVFFDKAIAPVSLDIPPNTSSGVTEFFWKQYTSAANKRNMTVLPTPEKFLPENPDEQRKHTLQEQFAETTFIFRIAPPESVTQAINGEGSKLDWDTVRDYVWELKNKLPDSQSVVQHHDAINIFVALWQRLSPEDQINLESLVEEYAFDFADQNKILAAADLIQWKQDIYTNSNGYSKPEEDESFLVSKRPDGPKFVKDILLLLNDTDFNKVGNFIQDELRDSFEPKPKVTFDEIKDFFGVDEIDTVQGPEEYPERVLRQIVQSFIETGYLKHNQKTDSYEFTARGKQTQKLGGDEITMISLANDILTGEPENEHVRTYEEVIRTYDDYWRENKLPKVDINVGGDRARTLYVTDALHGKNIFDPRLLDNLLGYVEQLPEADKPNIYVASGLIEGEHKFVRKNHRAELAGNTMRHLSAQLEGAKMIIDRLVKSGKPVVYSLSTEDFEECYNQTAETVRNLRSLDNQFRKNNKAFINYWQLDQLRTVDAWDRIFRFYVDVAYPYMLRSGRPLMNSDEVTVSSGGKLRIPEFLLLYNAHQRLSRGEKIPARWGAILNEKYIDFPGKSTPDDFAITNGMDMHVSTDDYQFTNRFLHNGTDFTDVTQRHPDLGVMKEDLAHEAVLEKVPPAAELDAHHGIFLAQALMSAADGGLHWGVELPSPLNTRQTKESLTWNVRGVKERNQRMRKDIPTPGLIAMEQRKDGVVAFDILTEKLNDKSTISPNRTAVITLNDFQVGSVTALVDYAATIADIAFREIAQNHKLVIVVNGDAIQGNIYKGMANENFATGLLPIDNQIKFVEDLLKLTFAGMTQQQKDNIVLIGSTAGNHETRSFTDFTGAYYINYQRQLFQKLLGDDNPDRVREFKAYETPEGAFIRGSVGFEPNLGGSGYGGIFMHEVMETKGKGGVPGAAVLATKAMNNAHVNMFQPYDASWHGHWHNEQITLNNDKVGIIAASAAAPSWYEYIKALQSHAGMTITYMGAHEPFRVEFWPKKTLAQHKISSGPLSDASLADEGFHTDEGFDPLVHGFGIPPMLEDGRPASALQKKLWSLIWHNAFERQILLGPKK